MSCNGCNTTGFSPMDQTWSRQSSLHYGRWTPYGSNGCGNAEYYSDGQGCTSCGNNGYNNLQNAWSQEANVTPNNHILWNKVTTGCTKEPYTYFKNGKALDYASRDKTWKKQKPFQT